MKEKQLRVYLIWAFAIAWLVQGVAAWLFWQGQVAAYQLPLMVSMFAPFVAVLLAGIPLRGMGWKPQLRGRWKWLFAAWFGPAILGVLGAGLYYALLPNRLDTTGAYLTAQLGEAGLAQLEAAGMTVPIYMLIQTVTALTWAPFVNMFAALGEEVGWRGVLYPRLKQRFGVSCGRVIGGVIWGIWHWPIMILTGYEYGLRYLGAPVLGMLLFCLYAVSAGTLIDFLYEKSECIWIPSLTHGAINAFAGVPLLVLAPGYADRMTIGPAMIGVVGGLPLLILAAILLLRDGRNECRRESHRS